MNDFVYDDMTVALDGTDNVRCYFVFMFQTANVSPVNWAQIAGLWSSFTDLLIIKMVSLLMDVPIMKVIMFLILPLIRHRSTTLV